MKTSEIRSLPEDEIESAIEKLRAKLFKAKFQAKGSGGENPGVIRQCKREIARMYTVLRERELQKRARAAGEGTGSKAASN